MAIAQDTKYAVIVLLMVLACARSLAWENLARIIPTAGHLNTAAVLTTRSASGNSCFSNSECSVQGCRSDDKQRENIWQIAVGVFVPLILILIFLMVFSCCRNTRRTAHRRSAPGEAVQLQTKELQSLQWI